MRKIRIGLIGCGGIGNLHLTNLLARDDVKIVALANRSKEKLERTGKRVPEANQYLDYREMLEKEEMDAVFVAVPPNSHDDIEILAARKGIHLFVEKPIGLSLEKIREVEKCINESGIISSVGFHQRYCPAVEEAKDIIARSEVGLANAWWTMGLPKAFWWRIREMSGGQVVEQSIHLYDLLRYFFGEPKTVYASAVKGLIRGVENYDIDDASIAVITFENGVVATVSSACYLEDIQNYPGAGFKIVCKDRVLEYHLDKELRQMSADEMEITPVLEDAHKDAAMVFVDAIKSGDSSGIRSTFSDSVKTMKLVLAAEASMRTGKPVDMDSM